MTAINPFDLPSVCLSRVIDLPTCSGFYFVISDNQILYIGKTKNFNTRWIQHHKSATLYSFKNVRVHWLEHNDVTHQNEQFLIDQYQPLLNGKAMTSNNQESNQIVNTKKQTHCINKKQYDYSEYPGVIRRRVPIYTPREEFDYLLGNAIPPGYDSKYCLYWQDIHNCEYLVIKVRTEFYLPKLVAVWKADNTRLRLSDVYIYIHRAFPKLIEFEIEEWMLTKKSLFYQDERKYLFGLIRVDIPYDYENSSYYL